MVISFEVYEQHLHRQCATVLLQDTMPRVLMNTRPETRPHTVLPKLKGLARITIAQRNTVGHKPWSTINRPKTNLHYTE